MNPSRRKIPLRFVIPTLVPPEQKWYGVQHKKFPQKLTRTQKRRIQRSRAVEKRKLPKKMPQEKPKEVKNRREEVKPAPNKTKFGRNATEDDESS